MDNTLHLFLLIGQSNMAGRGSLESVPLLEDPRVQMFRAGRWVPAREPLHADKATAGVGPGMSFALRLLEKAPEAHIGLLPCAYGGTKLRLWQRGEDLYEHAVAIARVASRRGVLRGVLWHQGEADSGAPELAAEHGDRFARMIGHLREDLGAPDVPVVAGELGPFLKDRAGCTYFETIVRGYRAQEGKLPRYACVSSAGLVDMGDHLHFDAASQRAFGERYAEAWLGLAGTWP